MLIGTAILSCQSFYFHFGKKRDLLKDLKDLKDPPFLHCHSKIDFQGFKRKIHLNVSHLCFQHSIYIYMYIYLEHPGTQMTPVLIGKGQILEG